MPTARPDLLAGEDLPGEPRQRRSIAKRVRILRAAERLFSQRGYERVSVQDIASAANIGVGGVYLYYRSKRQLLKALLDGLVEDLSSIQLDLTGRKDPGDALRKLLAAAFAVDLRFAGAYRAWQEAALSDAEIARLDRRLRRWSEARIAAVLRGLLRSPRGRRQVDLPTLAAALDRLFWTLVTDAPGFSPAARSRWVRTTSELILHAILRDARD